MTKKQTKQSAETPVAQMAHLMGEMTEAALAGQAVGLKLLAAEMQVLSHLIPSGPATGETADASATEVQTPEKPDSKTDAEIEAGFDNMPI